MAKIDVSGIEGYTDMTAEEKVAALEGMEFPEPDMTGWVKKDLFDKKASELAALKKSGKPSDADAAKIAALEGQVKTLTEDKQRSEYKAQLIAQGYDDELATATADAMTKGDMTTVFANQKSFLEKHDQTLTANAMKNTPKPPAGGVPGAEDIQKKIDEAYSRGDYAAAVAYTTKLYELKTD